MGKNTLTPTPAERYTLKGLNSFAFDHEFPASANPSTYIVACGFNVTGKRNSAEYLVINAAPVRGDND